MLIRADANHEIGFGHVMRCLALAQQWCRIAGGQVYFASRQPAEEIVNRIESEGFELALIDAEPGSLDDASQTCQIAERLSAVNVVLDGYVFDEAYQASMQQFTTASDRTLLVVDDHSHLRHYHTDILLNQNCGASQTLYKGKLGESKSDERCQLLLGSRFALLRDEFLRVPSSDVIAHTNRVLVSLGGSDPVGITQKVIDGIEMLSNDSLEFTVLSCKRDLRVNDSRIDLVPFTDNVAKLYSEAGLAICAGGSTNWELSYFGVPRLVITLAENQTEIAASLHELGCCISLGWHTENQAEDVASHLQQLIESEPQGMREANQKLIDGQGGQRVVEALVERVQAALGRRRK